MKLQENFKFIIIVKNATTPQIPRFTPYEWPTNDQQDRPENQFTLINCLWFAIGKKKVLQLFSPSRICFV